MGSPGIGKSVFGLYLVARLMASECNLFSRTFLLMTWLPERKGQRRWILVDFSGQVTEITEARFYRLAENRVFAILDGIAFHKNNPIPNYLSIVSPSECVSQPAASELRYVPPIEPENLDLLAGLSQRYPLSDNDPNGPPLLATHGSIGSRMLIAGGNLRYLFSGRSLEQLKAPFIAATKAMEFTQVPESYFDGPRQGTKEPFHRAFACFPRDPYQNPGEIGFVSDFVMDLLQKAFADLSLKEVYDAVRIARGVINELLGFSLRDASIRGKLFEDVCYEAMLHPKRGTGLQLRIEPFTITPQTPKADFIPIPPIEFFIASDKLTSIPAQVDFPSLWAAANRLQRGFDAVLFPSNKAVFVLQMTTNITHDPVSLSHLESFVNTWLDGHLSVYYVVLTDTLANLKAIKDNKAGMIVSEKGRHAPLPQYAGVLTDANQTYTVGQRGRPRIAYYPPHTMPNPGTATKPTQ
jgi:hypothetical protein